MAKKKRIEYKIGTIWVMPLPMTHVDGKLVPSGRSHYIIITGETWVEVVAKSPTNREINAASLRENLIGWNDRESIKRYELEIPSKVSFGWFLRENKLKPLPEDQVPLFRAALKEAHETLREKIDKQLGDFAKVAGPHLFGFAIDTDLQILADRFGDAGMIPEEQVLRKG